MTEILNSKESVQTKLTKLLFKHNFQNKYLTLTSEEKIPEPYNKFISNNPSTIINAKLCYNRSEDDSYLKLHFTFEISIDGNSWEDSIKKLFDNLAEMLRSAIYGVERNNFISNCGYYLYSDRERKEDIIVFSIHSKFEEKYDNRMLQLLIEKKSTETYNFAIGEIKEKMLEKLKWAEKEFVL